jgi:predicted aspartyl protease
MVFVRFREMIGTRIAITTLAVVVFSSATAAAQRQRQGRTPEDPIAVTLGADVIRVPMRIIQDQPAIQVRIGEEGPFEFLVDTGAEGNGRISRALAERFGLEKVGEVIAGDPSGRNSERRDLVGVPELSIGEAVWRDVPMLLASERSAERGIDGIIGFALFRDLLLTLDYPKRELTFTRGELPEVNEKDVVPTIGSRSIPAVQLDVAGTVVEADIDSGSMGWIMLPESIAKTLEFGSEPIVIGKAASSVNEFEIRSAPLRGTVRLGEHELTGPPIEFAEIFPRANIGGQFLRNFAVTFDQKNRRVRFERGSERPVQRAPRYRIGAMFAAGPEALVVRGTVEDSPAARAGLREGDVIEAINGKPVAEIGRAEMAKLFGSPKKLRLRVRRGEEVIEVEVTPEKAEGRT